MTNAGKTKEQLNEELGTLRRRVAELEKSAIKSENVKEAPGEHRQHLEELIREGTVELKKSDERFRLLVDGVKDYAIYGLDTKGKIVTWNKGAERIKGYKTREILGQHFSKFFAEEDVKSGKPQHLLEIAEAEGCAQDNGWRVRKDGSLFSADVVLTAIRDDTGQLMGYSKVTRDLTERKQANSQMLKVREIALGIESRATLNDVLSFVVESSRDITGIRFVLAQRLDESGKYIITPYYSRVRDERVFKLLSSVGFNINDFLGKYSTSGKLKFEVAKLKVSQDYLLNPRIINVERLSELLDGVWPRILCDSIQKILDIKQFVITPLLIEGSSWGNLLFFLDAPVSQSILETITAHCALGIKNVLMMDSLRARNLELAQSEEKYRNLVENAPSGIVIATSAGRIVEANEVLRQMHGYDSKEEFFRTSISERYYDSKDRDRWIALLREKGRVEGFEVQLKRKDGTPFWASLTSVPQETKSGEQQFIAVVQDITERKKMEAALLDSEKRYRSIFDTAGAAMVIAGKDTVIQLANIEFEKLSGYSSQEVQGKKSWLEFIRNSDMPVVEEARRRRAGGSGGLPRNIEARLVARDGTNKDVIINVSPLPGMNGFVSSILDITERKQAEEALRTSEEKLRSVFESVVDGIAITDFNACITDVNSRMLELFGVDSVDKIIGTAPFHWVVKDEHEMIKLEMQRTVEEGMVKDVPLTFLRADGSSFPGELNGSVLAGPDGKPIGLICLIRDVTERNKMAEQLMVTDRLASVGELASGIAHELNNPLTGVIGLSELLLEKEVPGNIREDLETIRSEAQRAARVVKNLLTFARKHPVLKEPLDVNEVIEKVLALRAYEQKVSNIQVNARLAPDLPKVPGDYFQLQQAFLNIIINAEFFMTRANGKGTLTITTKREGGNVRVSFADDGPGIGKEDLRHLFTPFFTTKEVGKGTGLGLSICHGIITAHNGRIYAQSEPGKGATFVVELPLEPQEDQNDEPY